MYQHTHALKATQHTLPRQAHVQPVCAGRGLDAPARHGALGAARLLGNTPAECHGSGDLPRAPTTILAGLSVRRQVCWGGGVRPNLTKAQEAPAGLKGMGPGMGTGMGSDGFPHAQRRAARQVSLCRVTAFHNHLTGPRQAAPRALPPPPSCSLADSAPCP